VQSCVGAKPEAPGGHAASAACLIRVVVDMYFGDVVGEIVGDVVGAAVGDMVGFGDTGALDGLGVGLGVIGAVDGRGVGFDDTGDIVGNRVGLSDTGDDDGFFVGGSLTGEAEGDLVGGSLTGAAEGLAVGGSLTGDAVGLFVGGFDTGDTDGLEGGEGVNVACTAGSSGHATLQEHGQLSMSSSTCSWVKPTSMNMSQSKKLWAWHGKFIIDTYVGESRHRPSKHVSADAAASLTRSSDTGATPTSDTSNVKLVSCVL